MSSTEPARELPRAAQAARRASPTSGTVPGGRLPLVWVPRALGLVQAVRLAGCALALAGDWLIERLVDRVLAPVPEGRSLRRRAFEGRSAARVVSTLGALKGPYAKLGQFAALRVDVLPPSWTTALGELRDRVPPLPFERVRAAVEAELGAPLEALFRDFDPVPLGAASIAQVHPARLPDGERVAVKVQYPWLETSLSADLAILRGLTVLSTGRAGARMAARRRLFEEFSSGLRDELDFEREARVADEIRRNLADEPDVVVPRVIPTHSTRRVLTLRYHPAVGIADRSALARLGVEPAAVLRILGRAYARQIFEDGLFHADPHPGNLFVLDEPGAGERPRVLFVDFGLSRRLDAALRSELRRGLYALFQRDLEGFLDGMDRMGMIAPGAREGVRYAVAGMFERIARQGGAAGLGGDRVLTLKDDARALLQDTDGLQLPNDLLLYAKTLSYVFALGSELAPEVDLKQLCMPYLLRFLASRDEAPAASAGSG